MRLLLALLIVAACAFAQSGFAGSFESQTSGAGLPELVKDWRVLSVAAIMASLALVAIAYAVGIGMEIPEVKAWAGNELIQIFATVLIVIALMSAFAVLDTVAVEATQASGLNIGCGGGQGCLQQVADTYLGTYINVSREDTRKIVLDSIDAGAWAARRFGIYCTSIYCLQIGATFGVNGHYVLDTDRYAIVFEYYTGILSSLEAQRFFVSRISFVIGPQLIAMGIVGRSFFFTRKLGGLLMAIGVGIMMFLPGMYLFDWFTLDTTLTGNKASADAGGSLCPGECKVPHLMAYVENGSQAVPLGSIKQVYEAFPSSQSGDAAGIVAGTAGSAVPSGGAYEGMTVTSCMVVSDADCPMACRELPYPTSLTDCMDQDKMVPQKCAALLPDKCWLRRYAGTVPGDASLSYCPDECRIVPPMKGDCFTGMGQCLSSRPECRVFKGANYSAGLPTAFVWAPDPDRDYSEDQYERCVDAQSCVPDANASKSCSYVVPDTGQCSSLCQGCPEVCRVVTGNLSRLPSGCIDEDADSLTEACKACPVGCKVSAVHIEEADTGGSLMCQGCDAEKRIIAYGEALPEGYVTGKCDIGTNCPAEGRVAVPRTSCEQCIFSEESQMYEPPIQPDCTDLCRPSDDLPVKNPAAYTAVGAEGLVGSAEIQNVSKLMLPGYVLPLFNIVATLAFIRGLSAALGGDIEIPGISKVV